MKDSGRLDHMVNSLKSSKQLDDAQRAVCGGFLKREAPIEASWSMSTPAAYLMFWSKVPGFGNCRRCFSRHVFAQGQSACQRNHLKRNNLGMFEPSALQHHYHSGVWEDELSACAVMAHLPGARLSKPCPVRPPVGPTRH